MISREAKTQFGIVGVIDVLGASTYSTKEARKYLESRDIIIAAMESKKDSLVRSFPETDKPVIYTFGDTILFVWNIGDKTRLSALAGAATWLRSFVALGFVHMIPLRGAMSIGEYIEGGNCVLGPAVADAAAWYEQADWMGIISTPSCYFSILTLTESPLPPNTPEDFTFHKWFVKYDVPLRDGSKRRLWAIPWPYDVLVCKTPQEPHGMVLKVGTILKEMRIPKGTESKYFNSFDFFQWYAENVFPDFEESKKNLK